MGLAVVYSSRSEAIARTGDFWFGSDIPRHIDWVEDPDRWYRAQLHPASAAFYKAYGAVARKIGVETPGFVASAVPAALATAGAVAVLGSLLNSASSFAIAALVAVLVGPTLVFSPVPESHMLGGAALLLQAILMLRAIRLDESNEGEETFAARSFAASIAFGCLATGFTLTNIAPAIAIACTRASMWRRHFRQGLLTAGSCVVGGSLFLVVLDATDNIRAPWHPESIHNEMEWSALPSCPSLLKSVGNVFVAQFGVPNTRSITWERRVGDVRPGIRVTTTPATLSVVAASLWMIAFVVLYRESKGAEKSFLRACALALMIVVTMHSAIAIDESYMFAPHAWPYVALPLVLALTTRPLRYATSIPAAAAVVASLLQSVVGFQALYRSLSGA